MKAMDELKKMFIETGELDEARALAAKKVLTADIQLMIDIVIQQLIYPCRHSREGGNPCFFRT